VAERSSAGRQPIPDGVEQANPDYSLALAIERIERIEQEIARRDRARVPMLVVASAGVAAALIVVIAIAIVLLA
jgi:hypothetical protein